MWHDFLTFFAMCLTFLSIGHIMIDCMRPAERRHLGASTLEVVGISLALSLPFFDPVSNWLPFASVGTQRLVMGLTLFVVIALPAILWARALKRAKRERLAAAA